MVERLDVKDKKILHELEIDSRQTFSSIAKKVGLSKEVVRYRIKCLEKEDIIDKYIAILNAKKIGYEAYKWYLQLENADTEKLKTIIEELKKHPYCVWVTTCTGKWDLIVVFFVISSLHFKEITNYFLSKFGSHIRESTFTIELDIYHFKKKFLWEEELKLYRTPYFGGNLSKTKLDKEEIEILIHFCENPKQSVVDISKKTKLSIEVVRHRLDKLENEGIIQGTRVQINNVKIGFESYKLLLNIKNINKEKETSFINYLKYNKNVWDVIYCLGNWNMEINIDVKNSVDFHNIVMDMKNRFYDIIQSYDSVQIFNNYKHNFFPMGKYLLQKINK